MSEPQWAPIPGYIHPNTTTPLDNIDQITARYEADAQKVEAITGTVLAVMSVVGVVAVMVFIGAALTGAW